MSDKITKYAPMVGAIISLATLLYMTGWKAAEISHLQVTSADHEVRLRKLTEDVPAIRLQIADELSAIKSDLAASRSRIEDLHRYLMPGKGRAYTEEKKGDEMGLKDQIREDVRNVILNTGELAEEIGYLPPDGLEGDRVTIPAIVRRGPVGMRLNDRGRTPVHQMAVLVARQDIAGHVIRSATFFVAPHPGEVEVAYKSVEDLTPPHTQEMCLLALGK